MTVRGRMRAIGDLALAVGQLTLLYVSAPPRPVTFTVAEVLAMSSRSFAAELDKAKLEHMVMRAEIAATRAERAARRIGWVAALAACGGSLTGMGIWAWLT